MTHTLYYWLGAAAILLYFWFTTDRASTLSPQERWQRDEHFREKVRELEIDYKNRPQDLRLHTVWLALLGYAVVWGCVILLIAVGVALGKFAAVHLHAGKWPLLAGLIPIGFALKLALSLISGRGGDSGVRLYRKDAPDLFKLLDKIRKNGKGPPFSRVFINMEMNASVSRHTGPAGSFGFGPVTLTLGLPLMQALTTAQVAGVIGHEYGHVAARHNALGHWVYRIRNSWLHLEDKLKTEKLWYTLRLHRFYRWFMGIFNAYSFTLSRQCEYEADAFAAQAAGAKNIANALVAMEVQADRLQHKFWEPIWQKSGTDAEPTVTPYQQLGDFFKRAEDSKQVLKMLQKKATGYDSTHPALPDRLSALKEEISPPEPLALSAATRLLGERLEYQLAMVFDRAWQGHNRKLWRRRHRQYQTAAKTLSILQSRKLSMLTRDDLIQMINAAYTVQDDRKIMEACQELLSRESDNTAAQLHLLGLKLINDHDESALMKLDDLVRLHPEHLPTACRFALKYLHAQEREEEAKVYQFRLDEWQYQDKAAKEERKLIFNSDVFLPHNMAPEYLKKLTVILSHHPAISGAWMARKQVEYNKDEPCFVIGLKKSAWRKGNRRFIMREINRALTHAGFPPYFRFYWVDEVKKLEKRLKKIAGSKIR